MPALMKKGNVNMKILKIDQNKGFIATNIKSECDFSYKTVEEATKEDILAILDFAIKGEINMDKVTKENELLNPVQKTVYESLYAQFEDFLSNKDKIIKDVNDKFRDAEEKYLSE